MTSIKPLQNMAYEYLKGKITNGELEHGTFYSERKMAAEIGISRTPFKEALVRLSQDHYIDIVPSKGFCLHALSLQDITDIYQSRSAIEGFCAFFLHMRRKEDEAIIAIRAIEKDLNCMEQAILRKAPLSEILSHDLSFHRRIVEFSKNDELIKLYESHNYQLYRIATETFSLENRPSNAAKEHREILNQIISDEENAGANTYLRVIEHMENTKDIVIGLLK